MAKKPGAAAPAPAAPAPAPPAPATRAASGPVAEGRPSDGPVAESDVRASDADRDRIAEILREALAEGRLDAEEHGERIDAVYAAKTLGELQPLVRDLPAARESAGPGRGAPGGGQSGASFSASYSSGAPAHFSHFGHGPKENLVAIFSGASRRGRWRVPRKINAFALFGGIEIDLTEAVFEQQFVEINATALFGGVDIRVPENVTLQQKGAGVFGGFDVQVTDAPDPQAPVVLVRGAGVFGGVDARPKKGKVIEDLRRRFRKEP
ncbi:DUF1707 SHOCT-like domain-containing protein [Streptomyces boncukensis]|uniref:DUF1707 domain-containing protein n=1 Tax=Streptomyces boncukensis TaxID=2711219 RepID=A0A6G4X6J1_9ACTN|nr:DUF1707 domain-containing protein [Streptomyces boncukensis]NGO72480.1 DUF1707 domain-containing protein [Streptomyces boncukensis]